MAQKPYFMEAHFSGGRPTGSGRRHGSYISETCTGYRAGAGGKVGLSPSAAPEFLLRKKCRIKGGGAVNCLIRDEEALPAFFEYYRN
jgi:hypothetical protein